MNPAIQQLFSDYLAITDDKAAAANLALADVMLGRQLVEGDRQPASAAETVPDQAFSVAEAALRLHVSERRSTNCARRSNWGTTGSAGPSASCRPTSKPTSRTPSPSRPGSLLSTENLVAGLSPWGVR